NGYSADRLYSQAIYLCGGDRQWVFPMLFGTEPPTYLRQLDATWLRAGWRSHYDQECTEIFAKLRDSLYRQLGGRSECGFANLANVYHFCIDELSFYHFVL